MVIGKGISKLITTDAPDSRYIICTHRVRNGLRGCKYRLYMEMDNALKNALGPRSCSGWRPRKVAPGHLSWVSCAFVPTPPDFLPSLLLLWTRSSCGCWCLSQGNILGVYAETSSTRNRPASHSCSHSSFQSPRATRRDAAPHRYLHSCSQARYHYTYYSCTGL